jgi:hypothetical protein
MNTEAASTDGRATFYANGQAHMFERKVVIKKQRGVLNMKKQNHLFFLFLPKAVFEHVYISTLLLNQGMISSFFWVLIDLIIGFLGLIIKAFDNQTEIWA